MDMRLDTFLSSDELRAVGQIAHYIEMFADRHHVTADCPKELLVQANAYCSTANERSNQSVCAAYRNGLLP